MIIVVLPQKFWGMHYFKAPEITSKLSPSWLIDKFTAFGCILFERCKPWVNQILSCANQNQLYVNFFAQYATHKSQQFRNVLQNPVDPGPILHAYYVQHNSWFNQTKSLFGVKKSLLSLSQFSRVCPPMSVLTSTPFCRVEDTGLKYAKPYEKRLQSMVLTFHVVPSWSGEDPTTVSIARFVVDARAKRKTFVPMNIEMQFIEKHKIMYRTFIAI